MENNDFYKCISELESLYSKNPQKASMEAKALLSRLKSDNTYEVSKTNSNGLFSDIGKDKLYMGVAILIIVLLGLLNLRNAKYESIPFYYGGLIFFLAGYFVSMSAKGFGLVFLFSHGGTGFCLMMASFLIETINPAILSDSSPALKSYLATGVLFAISGFIAAVLYNLSDNFKSRNLSKIIPLVLLIIALLMAAFLPEAIRML